MEAKPICWIKFNAERSFDVGGRTANLSELFDIFGNMMPDYHVLCSFADSLNGIFEVECFHEKDFTEIQYQELKSMIEEAINNQKIKNE